MGRYFGTDGVRGVANTELTCETALRIGRASAALAAGRGSGRPKVLIGKDTRVSSDMLENALAAGVCSAGADAVLLGSLPAPGVACLVKQYQADAGIMISASHNPAEYNGIKVFDAGGYKLDDAAESRIEALMDGPDGAALAGGSGVGTVSVCSGAADDYVNFLCAAGGDLSGLKVAADCANGASYETARRVLKRLGADAVFTGVSPDGRNINDGVGSTHLASVRELVLRTGADIGVAFDGDADRCLAVDETGEEIDGDRIIGVLARHLKEENKLNRDTVVVTAMTNLGFVEYCGRHGISAVRTAVGDRYVLEEMRKNGYSLGGEQSGHVILLDRSTTGDGELTAILLLSILKKSGQRASEMFGEFKRYPQLLLNIRTGAKGMERYRNSSEIAALIGEKQRKLGENGRVLVRISGTEPLIRVMVESKSEAETEEIAGEIAKKIRETVG